MEQTFEYLLVQSQLGNVTFVNGKWQGRLAPNSEAGTDERVIESCPKLWVYLNDVGSRGWELVAAYSVAASGGGFERFVLKRPRV